MIGTVGPGLSGVNLKMLAITRLSMYQMTAVNQNVYRAKPLGSEIRWAPAQQRHVWVGVAEELERLRRKLLTSKGFQ